MTLIAQFDLEQEPPAVVTLYDYGHDDIPAIMVPPEYVDVTDEDPRPQPGSTFTPNKITGGGTWTHPPPPEDTFAWAQAALALNDAFMALPEIGEQEIVAQVAALTDQVSDVLRRTYGLE